MRIVTPAVSRFETLNNMYLMAKGDDKNVISALIEREVFNPIERNTSKAIKSPSNKESEKILQTASALDVSV